MKDNYKLIEKLYFERICGSENEHKARDIIVKELEDRGLKVETEEFTIDGLEAKKSKLFVDGKEFSQVVSAVNSMSTGDEGEEGELAYITSYMDASVQDLEGKICLYHRRYVDENIIKILIEKKIKGLILCSGQIDNEEIEINPYHSSKDDFSKFPVVFISFKDGDRLVKQMPKRVRLVSQPIKSEVKSYNIITKLIGSEKQDEEIVFTAHYDSVPYSKGAYDNASGCAMIMRILDYFLENPPKRTMKFIWFGSEEIGLVGSKKYVEKHESELSKIRLCVNVDMIGVTLGTLYAEITAEKELVSYVKYLGYEKGVAVEAIQKIYSSDASSFADRGVPAISFIKRSPIGGAQIHSRYDKIENLSKESFENSGEFINEFVKRMDNSVAFPVLRTIPQNMLDELDYYYRRKKRPQN